MTITHTQDSRSQAVSDALEQQAAQHASALKLKDDELRTLRRQAKQHACDLTTRNNDEGRIRASLEIANKMLAGTTVFRGIGTADCFMDNDSGTLLEKLVWAQSYGVTLFDQIIPFIRANDRTAFGDVSAQFFEWSQSTFKDGDPARQVVHACHAALVKGSADTFRLK